MFHESITVRRIVGALAVFLVPAAAPAQDLTVRSALVTLVDDVQISAKEAGPLTAVGVQVGSVVRTDQLLARIDDAKSVLALKRAQADVNIAAEKAKNDTAVRFARKTKAVAAAELRRGEDANRRFPNSVSASEMDGLRLSVEKADAQIEQAQADQKIAGMTTKLKEADRDLADADVKSRRIVSPIGGKVVEVNRRAGEWVKPGDKVFRIISLDRLRAKGFVKFASIRGKLEGRSVVLTVDLPGYPKAQFRGKVTFVSDEVDPNGGDVAVWAEIKNPGHRLKPGLHGTMTIRGN
jgi:multidrug efflux pump subunit AcrA (membrane-fusion protein)